MWASSPTDDLPDTYNITEKGINYAIRNIYHTDFGLDDIRNDIIRGPEDEFVVIGKLAIAKWEYCDYEGDIGIKTQVWCEDKEELLQFLLLSKTLMGTCSDYFELFCSAAIILKDPPEPGAW